MIFFLVRNRGFFKGIPIQKNFGFSIRGQKLSTFQRFCGLSFFAVKSITGSEKIRVADEYGYKKKSKSLAQNFFLL